MPNGLWVIWASKALCIWINRTSIYCQEALGLILCCDSWRTFYILQRTTVSAKNLPYCCLQKKNYHLHLGWPKVEKTTFSSEIMISSSYQPQSLPMWDHWFKNKIMNKSHKNRYFTAWSQLLVSITEQKSMLILNRMWIWFIIRYKAKWK